MEDLQYIIGIGYSASDLPFALGLAFLFAMFLKRDSNVWKFALIALVIDRVLIPIGMMGASGAGLSQVFASLVALFKSFTDDLGVYIVRYIGLVLMISGFSWARAMVHKLMPGKAAHA